MVWEDTVAVGHSGVAGKEGGGHQLRMIEEKLNKARLLADKTPIFPESST